MATESDHPMMTGDCPRCGRNHTTFDLLAWSLTDTLNHYYDVFARCRACYRASMASVRNGANHYGPEHYAGRFIDHDFRFDEWVIIVPNSRECPAHVPEEIKNIFDEAASCEALGLWDAAGSMFRKVLDAATRTKTPAPIEGDSNTPAWKVYKDLRLRLDWLFGRQLLDPSLRELSSCIHQDGNDAVHDLVGIGKDEAHDLGDFVEVVLETMFTVPGQIAENKQRRDERRARQQPEQA